jgi:ectoine hydroxylase-related dioxygenase (phytanoyl-CoA dioxygenase family)
MTSARLTTQEIADFHLQGYLGPLICHTDGAMLDIRQRIEQAIRVEGPNLRNRHVSRHMDQPVVRELACCPPIVDRINDLMGPDLMLWATNFFIKHPGAKEIPWHQDLNYWAIDPLLNITAWIAIDAATVANACVNLIPGSHRRILTHVPSSAGMEFSEMADPAAFDASTQVHMELRPGQFFLFNERILHHSHANSSNLRRMGMTCRFSVPFVRIDHDALHPGHRALLVRGHDHHGLNRYL